MSNKDIGSVSKRANVPDWLINKSIGICKCMDHAIKTRMPLHIVKMYADESDRIAKEYDKYVC
jgi:hypothetical protein